MVGAPVEDQPAAIAGNEVRLAEMREGMRDRRALGPDEAADEPMRQWQRQVDPVGLNLPPALGELPQEQGNPDVGTRMASGGALHVQGHGAAHAALDQPARDLRPGAHALREVVVQDRYPCRHEDAGQPLSLEEDDVAVALPRAEQVAIADQLARRAAADLGVQLDHALHDQEPQAPRHLRQQRLEVELAGREAAHPGRGGRAGGHPHSHVEARGELLIEIEQILVAKRGGRWALLLVAAQRDWLARACIRVPSRLLAVHRSPRAAGTAWRNLHLC